MTACHLVTYFVAGLIAYTLFDYRGLFQTQGLSSYMRPVDSKWVAAGPSLQVIRGLILALALYPFRHVVLREPKGWLKLWGLLVGLCVLSAAGPAPSSVEGLIYTQLSWVQHFRGLPEVILQNLGLAVLLVGWYRSSNKAWGIVMYALTVLGILMSLAGVFLPRTETFK